LACPDLRLVKERARRAKTRGPVPRHAAAPFAGFSGGLRPLLPEWTLTFLDAEVRGNPATKEQLSTMAIVAGGGDDSVVIFCIGAP